VVVARFADVREWKGTNMPPHFEAAVPLGGPLLSAGEGVIGLIVVALTIASWIVNVVSQYSQAKPQPVVRPRGNRSQDSGRDRDSSTFGEQDRPARQNSQKKRSQPEARPGQKPQQKQPKQPQQRRPSAPPPPPVPSDQEQPRRPLGGTISGRHLETQSLGQGVRESVRDHMTDHALSKTVAQDMKSTVGAAVQDHLGAFSTGSPAATVGAAAVGQAQPISVVAMFLNPETMRQTMIANIVLSKPPCLEKWRRKNA
jgi:hypothetical protein